MMLIPEKLNVRFSSSFRLKTTFKLIYIKQFVEACHRCDYTSVEAGRLKTHLMLSLTKNWKIINFSFQWSCTFLVSQPSPQVDSLANSTSRAAAASCAEVITSQEKYSEERGRKYSSLLNWKS